jgi:hypothetical protein
VKLVFFQSVRPKGSAEARARIAYKIEIPDFLEKSGIWKRALTKVNIVSFTFVLLLSDRHLGDDVPKVVAKDKSF